MAEYIEREALIAHIKDLPTWWADAGGVYGRSMKYPEGMFDCEDVISSVENAPVADVAPVVHGLWMPVYESEMTGWNPAVAGRDPIGGYICSACKEEAVYDCNDKFILSNYCPNCGAKMDGGEDHAVS